MVEEQLRCKHIYSIVTLITSTLSDNNISSYPPPVDRRSRRKGQKVEFVAYLLITPHTRASFLYLNAINESKNINNCLVQFTIIIVDQIKIVNVWLFAT